MPNDIKQSEILDLLDRMTPEQMKYARDLARELSVLPSEQVQIWMKEKMAKIREERS